MYISRLKANEDLEFNLREGRGAWIQIVRGQVTIEGQILEKGDAASFTQAQLLKLQANQDSEFLLFDLA